MAKATTKKTAQVENKQTKKMPSWSTIWQNIVHWFFTALTTVKILGVGGAGVVLILNGMSKTDAVYIGLGAVLTAYGIIILVLTAHVATKYRVQDNTKGL